jgi:hypothetical protein
MLPLEYRKDQSAFLVGIISTIPITSRRMRRSDRRLIWMTGSIDSPISAFVSQKVVWASLAHAQIGEMGGFPEFVAREPACPPLKESRSVLVIAISHTPPFCGKNIFTSVRKSNEFSAGSYSTEE